MASASEPALPRVTITYCTQCKWMLRAAYFAQELLSTFGIALGEVALRPATGGVFTVDLAHHADGAAARLQERRLWDRKADGGFPEVKELKRRLRDAIEPGRDLGHVDRGARREGSGHDGEGAGRPGTTEKGAESVTEEGTESAGPACRDCES